MDSPVARMDCVAAPLPAGAALTLPPPAREGLAHDAEAHGDAEALSHGEREDEGEPEGAPGAVPPPEGVAAGCEGEGAPLRVPAPLPAGKPEGDAEPLSEPPLAVREGDAPALPLEPPLPLAAADAAALCVPPAGEALGAGDGVAAAGDALAARVPHALGEPLPLAEGDADGGGERGALPVPAPNTVGDGVPLKGCEAVGHHVKTPGVGVGGTDTEVSGARELDASGERDEDAVAVEVAEDVAVSESHRVRRWKSASRRSGRRGLEKTWRLLGRIFEWNPPYLHGTALQCFFAPAAYIPGQVTRVTSKMDTRS